VKWGKLEKSDAPQHVQGLRPITALHISNGINLHCLFLARMQEQAVVEDPVHCLLDIDRF
jgi:hypothetical protein